MSATDMRESDGSRLARLDACDLDILRLVGQGYQMDVVASHLHLSSRTVRRRTRAMCDRTGARAPIQVAVWAAREGLI